MAWVSAPGKYFAGNLCAAQSPHTCIWWPYLYPRPKSLPRVEFTFKSSVRVKGNRWKAIVAFLVPTPVPTCIQFLHCCQQTFPSIYTHNIFSCPVAGEVWVWGFNTERNYMNRWWKPWGQLLEGRNKEELKQRLSAHVWGKGCEGKSQERVQGSRWCLQIGGEPWSHVVSELHRFATWDVLFKNEMCLPLGSFIYLQQVKEGVHIQSSISLKGGLAIAHIHYLVNSLLISSP